ncbi:hypothetical protein Tco_0404907 [Tanacetum coccineum]
MDIREEIRLSKEDKLPESSGLPHSGQQRSYLIEMSILWRVRFISVLGKLGKIELAKKVVDISLNQGNKAIRCYESGLFSVEVLRLPCRASRGTGRGSSRKWITSDMAIAAKASRQVLNPKPVSEFNPTVGHERPLKKTGAVVEKPDAVVKNGMGGFLDVLDKKSAPAKKPTSVVVQDKDSVVVNYPAELDQEKDKEKHKASAKEPVSIVDRVCEVAKHIMFHVEDALKNDAIEKASDVNDSDALKNTAADVKEKSDGKIWSTEFDQLQALFQKKKLNVVSKDKPKSTVEKASDVVSDKPVVKKSVNAPVVAAVESVVEKDNPKVMSKVSDKPSSVVGKDKDKAKNIAPRLSKQKENPEFKAKVNVKRKMILSKEDDNKKKFKGKSKKDVSDSELETDVVDEADRKISKRKKLKRERSDSDSSDSSELDRNIIKRLISKLEKKVKKEESDDSVPKKVKKKLTKRVKKEESDEDTVPQKGKKKEKQLTPEEAAHEKYLSSFPPFHARTTPSSLFLPSETLK